MARGDYFVGKNSIIGWALQAVDSGTRWDGTPGTARYCKPMSGGMNYTLGADQNPDDTMDVDPQSYTAGATKHNGSFKMLLSYEHQELLFIAGFGLADVIAGSGPYTHTIDFADTEVYLTLYAYHEDFKGTKFLRTYTNAIITNLTIEGSPEQRPTLTINWAAQSVAKSTPGATPTLNVMDLVKWSELTVTLDSTAICANSLTFVIDRPVDDSDICMGADAPGVNTLFGSGQRSRQLTIEGGVDDSIETILEATDTAVAASVTWDNGEATTSNRKIELTTNFTVRATTLDTVPATWGKRRESVNFVVETLDDIIVTNSLDVAQL